MKKNEARNPVPPDALLAFPPRRHFDCDVDRCDVCLADHAALSRYIETITQAPARNHDFLGEYRRWLDDKGIPAEGGDGWATREAWDVANVNAFIFDHWGIDANNGRTFDAPKETP